VKGFVCYKAPRTEWAGEPGDPAGRCTPWSACSLQVPPRHPLHPRRRLLDVVQDHQARAAPITVQRGAPAPWRQVVIPTPLRVVRQGEAEHIHAPNHGAARAALARRASQLVSAGGGGIVIGGAGRAHGTQESARVHTMMQHSRTPPTQAHSRQHKHHAARRHGAKVLPPRVTTCNHAQGQRCRSALQ
jgi:hypothetical protein